MHTFIRSDGKVFQSERFMQGPRLGEGKVWANRYENVWIEEDSPHSAESNPNHASYELHIFGEHHETFMKRQHNVSRG